MKKSILFICYLIVRIILLFVMLYLTKCALHGNLFCASSIPVLFICTTIFTCCVMVRLAIL